MFVDVLNMYILRYTKLSVYMLAKAFSRFHSVRATEWELASAIFLNKKWL